MTERIVEPQDRVGVYADAVRDALADGEPRTVREIRAVIRLSERLVRDGLNRLIFLKRVEVRQRVTPGARGLSPWTYRLIAERPSAPSP